MTYISIYYYLFVILLLIVYYILPLKYRWYSLLVGSLGFYYAISKGSLKAIAYMLGITIIAWAGAILVEKKHDKKLYLTITIIVLAGTLFFLKQTNSILYYLHRDSLSLKLIAPIGISFFCMQLIAYIVDIYNGKVASEKDFFKFLLFVSFFPQVIQGPIPRYSQLSPQLTEGNRFDENGFVKGFMLIIWGFFLKLCIADKAAVIVNTVFDNSNRYVGWYVFIAGVLYSIQLYTDFLSCTTLAQGVAALFGIQIVDNFMHPYFATSIKDFWRRWHMSLSSWLRDYVYIPLGGNRNGVARKYINIMITFAVSGIWHGAGLKFLFWGLLHGLYQVIGDLTNPTRIKASRVLKIDKNSKEYQFLSQLITFFLVMIAWIIFRADSLRVGLRMIKSMVTDWNPWILTDNSLFALGLSWKEVAVLILSLMILIAVSIMQERDIIIRDCIIKRPIVTRWIVYICAIIFITVFGTYGYGFDAQSFIYGGF